jgi:hypothetical protein
LGPLRTSIKCQECETEHGLVLDEEPNRWEIETVSGQPAWQPMSSDEARAVLETMPKAGVTDETGFARLLEAWMVQSGADASRIRQAVEALLGRPLV